MQRTHPRETRIHSPFLEAYMIDCQADQDHRLCYRPGISLAKIHSCEMVAEVPQAYVATMMKAKRVGKIFIDYFRNDYTATSIADYAVRARPGACVALPLEWKDLDDLKSANAFNIRDVLKLVKKGKLAKGFKKLPPRIPAL